eukprot:511572_1
MRNTLICILLVLLLNIINGENRLIDMENPNQFFDKRRLLGTTQYPDCKFESNDIEGGQATKTLDECDSWCNSLSNCVGWTWDNENCFLKSAIPKCTRQSGVISGDTRQTHWTTRHVNCNYENHDLSGGQGETTLDECDLWCKTLSICVGWTWDKGNCYLKGFKGNLNNYLPQCTFKLGVISGDTRERLYNSRCMEACIELPPPPGPSEHSSTSCYDMCEYYEKTH